MCLIYLYYHLNPTFLCVLFVWSYLNRVAGLWWVSALQGQQGALWPSYVWLLKQGKQTSLLRLGPNPKCLPIPYQSTLHMACMLYLGHQMCHRDPYAICNMYVLWWNICNSAPQSPPSILSVILLKWFLHHMWGIIYITGSCLASVV